MTFEDILDQALAMLQRRGRVTYGTLQRQFALDAAALEDLKDALLYAHPQVVDDQGRGLRWVEDSAATPTRFPAAPPPAAPHAQPDTLVVPSQFPDAERRQLTVMFCDLADSTRLSRQLDPEDLREVLRAYHTTCATVIQRFAGYIAQYLGDGLLVYFGYPQAHEDDAQRAVRTALGIVEAMALLNAQIVQDQGGRLAVRIGIHTGPVVVGEIGSGDRRERLALGDTPNLAARLQGLAAPDTVVLSDTTSRLVQGYFVCQDRGVQTLKGLDTPVRVFQVVGESAAQSRLDVAAASGLTPLVGRETEVTLLLERWAQARDGLGQVVLLSGEAGIGKSRLVEVLRARAVHEGGTRIIFRCSPYHTNSALYPVIEHIQRLLHWQRDDTPAEKLDKLEQALRPYRLALQEVVPLLAALLSVPLPDRYPPLSLTPQKQRQQTQAALVAWLLEEAERHPVLAVYEDLHWADPTTLELLGLLLTQAPTARMLTLLTCRPEFQPPWATRTYLTQITLGRLHRAQVAQMVVQLTGGKPLPAEVVEQVITKTDGVPLFVEELVKMILESGLVREETDGYALTGPLPPLAIPTTLHDSLMSRLDRLGSARALVQLAAVLGREFTHEVLQAVSPLDDATLQHSLRQLVEAELVYQQGLPPRATYVFKHALIQEAAYQSLLKRTRQQYHHQIAQMLEYRFPEIVETQPELLAHHYTEAGLNEQAIVHWQRAGERASARSAYVEAIAHLRKGLGLLQFLPETSARTRHELLLQCTLAASLTATHGYTALEVGQTYMRAHQLCQEIGEPPQLFSVLDGLRRFYVNRGEVRTGREVGEQLLCLAQRQHDTRLVQQAHNALGHALSILGEFTLARAHLEQSMACYTPQPHTTPASQDLAGDQIASLIIIAPVLWSLGYPDQALARIHDALSLTHVLAHPFTLAVALPVAARLHQFRREVQAAKEQAEAVITLASEQGFAQPASEGAIYLGWAMTIQGQGEEGIAQLRQGLEAYRATGVEQGMSHLLMLLAEAYGNLGHMAEGLAVLTETLAQVEQSGDRRVEAELYRLKGHLLLQQSSGHTTEAETCFHQAIAIAQNQSAKSWELRAATSLARLWQQQGKRAEAFDLLAPIYGWFTEGLDTADLQEAQALLEALA